MIVANNVAQTILYTTKNMEADNNVGDNNSTNGDNKIDGITLFRYIFAGGKSVYQILVQLAPGSIVDIHDTCFRLVESGVADKTLLAVIL